MQVKHSRTCSSSYERDFCELIEAYNKNRNQKYSKKTNLLLEKNSVGTSSQDEVYNCEEGASESEEDDDGITLPKRKQLSVEYLEDESDMLMDVDDFDGNFFLPLLLSYLPQCSSGDAKQKLYY